MRGKGIDLKSSERGALLLLRVQNLVLNSALGLFIYSSGHIPSGIAGFPSLLGGDISHCPSTY
jgi:hypothetical protein